MTSSASWCPMDGSVGVCGQLDPVGGAGQDKLILRCHSAAASPGSLPIDSAAPPLDGGAAGVGIFRMAEHR
jgi:hypothetical protein